VLALVQTPIFSSDGLAVISSGPFLNFLL
jgi:hypothetical protein